MATKHALNIFIFVLSLGFKTDEINCLKIIALKGSFVPTPKISNPDLEIVFSKKSNFIDEFVAPHLTGEKGELIESFLKKPTKEHFLVTHGSV